MFRTLFFDKIQTLHDSVQNVIEDSALIIDNELKAFGAEARKIAKERSIKTQKCDGLLLAPCLVDPHSILISPLNNQIETLKSLKKKASQAGYGQIALLPKGNLWRDRPELLSGFNSKNSDIRIHLWGALTLSGLGSELAPHANLLEEGAIGITDGDFMPAVDIIRKAILANEIDTFPILLAPRDQIIQSNGIVRESVETLRAGWEPDPIDSETLPLSQILELHKKYPSSQIRIMNLSTKEGAFLLDSLKSPPICSVHWWHLVTDNSTLKTSEIGWKVIPSIGSPRDREALKNSLNNGLISAVGVNNISLSEQDIFYSSGERLPGISGYNLLLPCLWNELIIKSNWSIKKLWDAISFGPSRLLNLKPEELSLESRRWLIFDPEECWVQSNKNNNSNCVANEPLKNQIIKGKVIACGLRE